MSRRRQQKNDPALPAVDHRRAGEREVLYDTPRIGKLRHGRSGEVLVEIAGGDHVAARLVARVDRSELLRPDNEGREVLLVFEKGDPERPIILDMMESPLRDLFASAIDNTRQADRNEAVIDGKRIVIDAEEEVVLRCGKGSITIRADGKVVVKGTKLLSRAEGVNRIKGGAVQIN